MKACEYCGRDNADGARFCRECGTQFEWLQILPEKGSPNRRSLRARILSSLCNSRMAWRGFLQIERKVIHQRLLPVFLVGIMVALGWLSWQFVAGFVVGAILFELGLFMAFMRGLGADSDHVKLTQAGRNF